MRVAVIDSTPLISFVHLELASQLALFFDRIYVPRAVQREVNQKQRFRYRLQKLYRAGVFERCAAADPYNVELLQADTTIDEGEAENTEELVRKLRRDLRFRVTEKVVAEAIALAPKAI